MWQEDIREDGTFLNLNVEDIELTHYPLALDISLSQFTVSSVDSTIENSDDIAPVLLEAIDYLYNTQEDQNDSSLLFADPFPGSSSDNYLHHHHHHHQVVEQNGTNTTLFPMQGNSISASISEESIGDSSATETESSKWKWHEQTVADIKKSETRKRRRSIVKPYDGTSKLVEVVNYRKKKRRVYDNMTSVLMPPKIGHNQHQC